MLEEKDQEMRGKWGILWASETTVVKAQSSTVAVGRSEGWSKGRRQAGKKASCSHVRRHLHSHAEDSTKPWSHLVACGQNPA